MTTRRAISGWLRDADQIPGHKLVIELAGEHDALLMALRECLTEEGAHCLAYGTDTPKLRARLMTINATARAAIAKAESGGAR